MEGKQITVSISTSSAFILVLIFSFYVILFEGWVKGLIFAVATIIIIIILAIVSAKNNKSIITITEQKQNEVYKLS